MYAIAVVPHAQYQRPRAQFTLETVATTPIPTERCHRLTFVKLNSNILELGLSGDTTNPPYLRYTYAAIKGGKMPIKKLDTAKNPSRVAGIIRQRNECCFGTSTGSLECSAFDIVSSPKFSISN